VEVFMVMLRTQVPITMRALVQRMNRRLGQSGQVLRPARSEGIQVQLGNWYVIDTRQNTVVQQHVDPIAFARELGVLHGWETVKEQ
jgi:hypothetical protein